MTEIPEKVGAGLLFCCQGQALLLTRNSKHNNNKLGLPGGNADAKDGGNLRTTAHREATEELTTTPEYTEIGWVLTKRGKRLQKHYTVFVCKLTPEVKEQYKPELNPEHSAWEWFPIDALRERDDLHPVVRLALHDHWSEVSELVKQA